MKFEHWVSSNAIEYLITRETALGKGSVKAIFPRNGGKKRVILNYWGSHNTRHYPYIGDFEMSSALDAIRLLKKLGGIIETE